MRFRYDSYAENFKVAATVAFCPASQLILADIMGAMSCSGKLTCFGHIDRPPWRDAKSNEGVSPLRGFGIRLELVPWAHAHGYMLSPLRG